MKQEEIYTITWDELTELVDVAQGIVSVDDYPSSGVSRSLDKLNEMFLKITGKPLPVEYYGW